MPIEDKLTKGTIRTTQDNPNGTMADYEAAVNAHRRKSKRNLFAEVDELKALLLEIQEQLKYTKAVIQGWQKTAAAQQ